MSIRIRLHYSKALDLELIEKNIEIWLRRITVQVTFQKPKGWSQPYEAIVDTGAPVSIIPPAIWQEIEKEVLGEYKIQGIVPKKDSFLPVRIANVFCVLMDKQNITDKLKIKAYLSLEEKAPLVLGFENIFSRAKLYLNPENGEGFIEI
jgi:hypothetical protein